jgi:putative transposase
MLILVSVTLQANNTITFQRAFHIVWCPKYRRRVLGGQIETRLNELIRDVIEEKGAWLVELGVLSDQVRLPLAVDPRLGACKLVKAIKGRTSWVPRRESPAPTSHLRTVWTNFSFVATVGGAPLGVVKRSVDNQKNR